MEIRSNVSLASYTSLHVGGLAAFFVDVASDADLLAALQWTAEHNLPFKVIGKGSNTVFSDAGWPGLIIHMTDRSLNAQEETLTAAAGVFMRQLVNFALKNNLRGLEELAGIPGTVGGAVRGNAGTWSTETKDVIQAVEVLLPDGRAWQKVVLDRETCSFGYRHSIFKLHADWIIVRAIFTLTRGSAAAGAVVVARDLQDRHTKQPYDAPSAGSVFKNPDKAHGIFSGKLIELSGLKGLRIGGAEVSPKHANFIVNRQSATASDVIALIRHIQATVQAKQGIWLEPELEIVESIKPGRE